MSQQLRGHHATLTIAGNTHLFASDASRMPLQKTSPPPSLMLTSLTMQGDLIYQEEPLRVTLFAGRLYYCERIFPFTKLLALAFQVPTNVSPLCKSLCRAFASHALITWDIRFNSIAPLQEQGYLIWHAWNDETVELQLATPIPGTS